MHSPKTRRETEIWQACDTLYLELGEGKVTEITGDKIVTKLLELGYKKGSPNEIYRYRQSWKVVRGFENSGDSTLTPLSDPLSRAIQLVKEEIEKEARAEIAELKAQYEGRLKNLEDTYHATKAELLRFIEQHDTVTHELTQAKAAHHALTLNNQALTEQAALLATQVNLLEQQTKNSQKHYVQSLSEIKGTVSSQQQEQSAQFVALKEAWQQDASDYKALNESQRHKFMMEAENYRAEIRQLTEKLKIAESEKLAAQQTGQLLKQQQLQQIQKLEEQLSPLEGKLNEMSDHLVKVNKAGHKEREARADQLNHFLLELKAMLLTSKKADKKAVKASRKDNE